MTKTGRNRDEIGTKRKRRRQGSLNVFSKRERLQEPRRRFQNERVTTHELREREKREKLNQKTNFLLEEGESLNDRRILQSSDLIFFQRELIIFIGIHFQEDFIDELLRSVELLALQRDQIA